MPARGPGRRAAGLAAAAVAASIVALPSTPVSASAGRGGGHGDYTTNCPRAESLVAGTVWHKHTLAPGLTLKEGQHNDGRGFVRMHVLTVDLTNRHLMFAPLARKLAMRTPLSQLAAGRPQLLAATNTGFFDFQYGAPLGPVVTRGQMIIGSAHPATVVGFGPTGLAQVGHVALAATVTSRSGSRPLAGLNLLHPPQGITAYTSRWGSEQVDTPRDAVARYVDNGVVTSGTGRYDGAPNSGYLLVARGQSSIDWLKSLNRGGATTVSQGVTSDTPKPFRQAYNVAAQIVAVGGRARTGMNCRTRYPQPARTAIGILNHGHTLMLTFVDDDPGTAMHGLDANQMARVMADLGANQAYLFDGSGSTELLARFPSKPSALSLRTYLTDGEERPMPVGLGIFRR
ncbi:MAG: hypothetical protein QOF18_2827 [Frankiaceae bacterium]|nr:hypothetical protein [Frankiaceae bacterium]